LDTLVLPDGSAMAVLADVCGKGLPAAMVAGSVHALVRGASASGADLVALMNLLNTHLVQYLNEGMFVTAVSVQIVPDGKCKVVCAGHPPPISIDGSGEATPLQLQPQLPLGVMDTPLVATEVDLPPAASLLLYSDGLTEATAPSGGMLGIAGVAALAAQSWHAAVSDRHTSDAAGDMQALNSTFRSLLHKTTARQAQQDDRAYVWLRRSVD
jgi:serine phosphatase RsbU (regulator of sigma subunit)